MQLPKCSEDLLIDSFAILAAPPRVQSHLEPGGSGSKLISIFAWTENYTRNLWFFTPILQVFPVSPSWLVLASGSVQSVRSLAANIRLPFISAGWRVSIPF